MPSRNPRLRFQNIVANIDAIERYTAGLGKREFLRADMIADAVERCLLRIAEAAVKLGDMAESLAPEQPWHEIRGLGNRLRHDYDGVDRSTIWSVVKTDLKPLRADCLAAIDQLERDR